MHAQFVTCLCLAQVIAVSKMPYASYPDHLPDTMLRRMCQKFSALHTTQQQKFATFRPKHAMNLREAEEVLSELFDTDTGSTSWDFEMRILKRLLSRLGMAAKEVAA